jgi:hypothetical protein
LILLIVLGMLAMFSLLAVTYVIVAGSSLFASRSLRTRDRNSSFSLSSIRASDRVLSQVLRGTLNPDSPMYMNSLLGDVWGPDPIRTSVGPFAGPNSVIHMFAAADAETNVNLVKVPLLRDGELNGPLSDLENEYNSRVMTFLEGPLSGQSFRILKYVGYVRDGSGTPDPNTIVQPPLPAYNVSWINSAYGDPQAADLRYSVLIDLNEIVGKRVSGEVLFPDGTFRSASRSLAEWIAEFGVASLFFAKSDVAPPNPGNMTGYKVLINDAPFNHPGIGLEDIALVPTGPVEGFGNIDSRRLFAIPRVSPSILAHYDYLSDPVLMALNPFNSLRGVDAIGSRRTDHRESRLNGASNEGFDVPDYRDFWLAHQTFANGIPLVTPSFHRPEVVQHVAHLFGNPSSMTAGQVNELLRLINASTGRVLNVSFGNIQWNTRFQLSNASFPKFSSNWSSPPTPAEIQNLQAFVLSQINGVPTAATSSTIPQWDVDNDGDSTPDSVWIDPGMDIVYSPEGRRLRPLAAILIEDLDSRINLNTAGDRVQGLNGFDTTFQNGLKRQLGVSQGFGYGPADISLTSLFQYSPALLQSQNQSFSFFDERNGARRYRGTRIPAINYNDPSLDRVAGRRRLGAVAGSENDVIGQVREREQHILPNLDRNPKIHQDKMPGLPLARNGATGLAFDVHGNPIVVTPAPVDANPYNPAGNAFPSEVADDAYESNAMSLTNGDDPLGLEELETILRRFDADAQSLPTRLKNYLSAIPGYNNLARINREITTRSGELRYPVIAAAMKSIRNFNNGQGDIVAIESGAPSYLRYIQMLHSQRYRLRSYPAAPGDDPELNYTALAELFPVEFSRGLKMDLNRPFGNGFDSDAGGDIDEFGETNLYAAEVERHPGSADTKSTFPEPVTSPVNPSGDLRNEESLYGRELDQTLRRAGTNASLNSVLRKGLAGRQVLARNLYCLAQLIVPKDFNLPGMPAYKDASGNVIAANIWPRAKIRARYLAQWAVNVVDYRDADSAMTRFEYDILPFGVGSNVGAPAAARAPYWAPDHVLENVNNVSNKVYVGVVWGVELPELLLTESMAYHNKNLKNTDMDSSALISDQNDSNSDNDLDQWRFPDAGLLLELYNPRSVWAEPNPFLSFPGSSSNLYSGGVFDNPSGRPRELDLARLTPSGGGTWGRQPVWRIAITEPFAPNDAKHPQKLLENNTLAEVTMQHSIEDASSTSGSAPARSGDSNLANVNLVEQFIGNDLFYNHNDNTEQTMPVGFERFVWFVGKGTLAPKSGAPSASASPVPDAIASVASNPQHAVYQPNGTPTVTLPGASYMVVGPKTTMNFGSLTHNQFTGALYPTRILRSDMLANAGSRPQRSPSFQRIIFDSANGNVITKSLFDKDVNAPFLQNVKPSKSLVCTTAAPVAPSATNSWTANVGAQPALFSGGVGINISLPPPVYGSNIWIDANRPKKPLNSGDQVGGSQPRADNTPGFGESTTAVDSYVDLANPGSDTFPDTPIDRSNPLLSNQSAPKYRSGTYENVRVACLQRVANPDIMYDPVFNPYITVDWISIDLTVFNGETSPDEDDRDWADALRTPNFTPPSPRTVVFQSRYKTGQPYGTSAGNEGVNYLSPLNVHIPAGTTTFAVQAGLPTLPPIGGGGSPNVDPASYYMYSLGQEKNVLDWNSAGASSTTFGYLNIGNVDATAVPNPPAPTNEPNNTHIAASQANFAGFGRPVGNANVNFRGAGEKMANPMWLDRQFASPYEILMVPKTSASQLGLFYNLYTHRTSNRDSVSHLNSYQNSNIVASVLTLPGAPQLSTPQDRWRNLDSYWAVPRGSGETNNSRPPWHEDWNLLLEFVETQPPFADANQYWRPDIMRNLANDNRITARLLNSFIPQGYYTGSEHQSVRGPSFLAPFHYKPSYVAAGKVNLNTVAFEPTNQSRVLRALEHLYFVGTTRTTEFPPEHTLLATEFLNSRRGYPSGVPNAFFAGSIAAPTGIVNSEMHPDFPTRFAGAVRPALSANFAPPSTSNVDANAKQRARFPVESTLLRSSNQLLQPANAPPSNDDLLIRRPGTPDFVNQTQPFDHLQRVMRLPNLTTNQSNVFAVWVTIGLFEYDPILGFGEEYVSETGGVNRERKFYIIDRTIPVGFKQGEDLNSRRTILLERNIP